MPSKLCLEPGCPNPVTGRGRCNQHRKPIERERSRRRREATKGTYKTRRWKLRRMQVFTRDPFCADGRMCGGKAPSVEVDHLISLDQGGDPYAMSNLRGTCRACHEAKTAQENRGRREGPSA
jgi:5-methylcytosine-specific restriction enzyme A